MQYTRGMHELITLWMSWVQDWGYAGVIILMAMESSIFPVPSEVVIPPAAILSAQPDAPMSFWGVVLAVKSESLPLILAVLVLAVCYIIMLRLTDKKKAEEGTESASPETDE